jgi:hypothetical protein
MVFQGRLIYTHVLNRGGKGVRSPADGLAKGIEGDYRNSLYTP